MKRCYFVCLVSGLLFALTNCVRIDAAGNPIKKRASETKPSEVIGTHVAPPVR